MSLKVRKNGQWVTIGVGEKGLKGDKGVKGDKGFKGFKGDPSDVKGEKGEKGFKGEFVKGQKGQQGDQGNDGDSVKGEKGFKGEKGDKGQKGEGEKGIKGEEGDKGSKGDKGIGIKGEGIKGDKGDKSDVKGDKGEKGEGAKGESVKGDKGFKGDKGEGVKGEGIKGDEGEKGIKGDKGEFKGEKGSKGESAKGDKGDAKGEKGAPGGNPVGNNNTVQYNLNGNFAGASKALYSESDPEPDPITGSNVPTLRLEGFGTKLNIGQFAQNFDGSGTGNAAKRLELSTDSIRGTIRTFYPTSQGSESGALDIIAAGGVFIKQGSSEPYFIGRAVGGSEVYHDGTKAFQTFRQTNAPTHGLQIPSTMGIGFSGSTTANHNIYFKAPAALDSSYPVGAAITFTLPTNTGTLDQSLVTDGNGILSFKTISGGGGSGTPAGSDKQLQFNDNGVFGGTSNIEYIKSTGDIEATGSHVRVKKDSTANNSATIAADGGLELKRKDFSQTSGGPYIDFTYDAADMDARIQMDPGDGGNTNAVEFSSLIFKTGGGDESNLYGSLNPNVAERLRIGKSGEIGIGYRDDLRDTGTAGVEQIYGKSGQVLTSAGIGQSVFWSDKTNAITSISKIEQGNTSAEVVDTGTDGHFKVVTENAERLRVTDTGAWGIEGASNYGATGQVLTSNGDDSPTWQDIPTTTAKGILGEIIAWGGTYNTDADIPDGYILCDGRGLDTQTYSELFAVLGYTHGGSGSTFNIPNLRDKFVVGAAGGYNVADQGGTNSNTLTTSNIPEHFHYTLAAQYVGMSRGSSNVNANQFVSFGTRTGGGWEAYNMRASSVTANVGKSSNAGGTGGTVSAIENRPPYYALCYIINATGVSGSGGSGSGSSFVLLSEQASTSGTEVEFTGIPSDALEITLMFKGVSPSGNDHMVVQLGTSSGYITSGYVGNSENSQGTSAIASNTTDKQGFVIFGSGGTSQFHGSMIINKASSNSYTEIGEFRKANTGGCVTRGSLSSVSGTVDRLKVKFNGSDTFDAGTMSLSYKTSGSGGSGGSGGTAGTTKVAILRDQKDATVGSGTGAANTWVDRDITVKTDPTNFVTLNARVDGQTTQSTPARRSAANGISYFALPAGTYKIKFTAVGYFISQNQAAMVYSPTESTINKVYATSDNVTKIYGTSETTTNSSASTDSTGTEVVTINQTTYFKVIHYAVSSFGQSDYGQTSSPDKNVYLEIEIEDLATAIKDDGGNSLSPSLAKAYVSFSGTSNTGNGGTCTIRDSFNVTSVTYFSPGHYNVNFATNFADTNYVTVVGHSLQPNNASTHGIMYTHLPRVDGIELYNCADNASSNVVDKDEVSIVFYHT